MVRGEGDGGEGGEGGGGFEGGEGGEGCSMVRGKGQRQHSRGRWCHIQSS